MLDVQTLATFEDLHAEYFEDICSDTVIWRKMVSNVDRWGEGESQQFEDIILKAQVSYNNFRVWPVNYSDETGATDGENLYLFINYQYLQAQGYISPWGNFTFDPSLDRFILKGLSYMPKGDTPVGPVKDSYISYMVILAKEPINTGDPLR